MFRFLKGENDSESVSKLNRCRRMYANVFVSAPSGYAFVSKATGRCTFPSTERARASSTGGSGAGNKRNGPPPRVVVAVHVGEAEQPEKSELAEAKGERTDRGHRGVYANRYPPIVPGAQSKSETRAHGRRFSLLR